MNTSLSVATPVVERICVDRRRAVGLAWAAAQSYADACVAIRGAQEAAKRAHGPRPRWRIDGAGIGQMLMPSRHRPPSPARMLEQTRRQIDAATWLELLKLTGAWDLMSTRHREAMQAELEECPLHVTEANVWGVFEGLRQTANDTLREGIVDAFTSLDRAFKSNDPFSFKRRIIVRGAATSDGRIQEYSSRAWSTINDVERIFGVLDDRAGVAADEQDEWATARLVDLVKAARPGFGARQSVTTSRYFKIRIWQNGNAHLWFTRRDLVSKVNMQLAAYYGQVLPDGVPKDEPIVTTELAKNLSFYRTPPQVVQRLIPEYSTRLRILEPSAGDGAIVEALLKAGHQVDAVEIDPGRCAQLARLACFDLTITRANFLRMTPRAVYDWVVMNSPFWGTHWMSHVRHAWDFVAPGGYLNAVLPITADTRETKAHTAFRKWASPYLEGWHKERGQLLTDLPIGAFKESGTMVSTGILSLRKPKR